MGLVHCHFHAQAVGWGEIMWPVSEPRAWDANSAHSTHSEPTARVWTRGWDGGNSAVYHGKVPFPTLHVSDGQKNVDFAPEVSEK